MLIVNPVASSVTRRARVVIQKGAVGRSRPRAWPRPARTGQAIRLARGAARDRHRTGSSPSAVTARSTRWPTGCWASRAGSLPCPAARPMSFARAIGYPNDAIEATATLLGGHRRRDPRSRPVWAWPTTGPSCSMWGRGFDAAVVNRVEKRGQLKRYMGHPFFVASTFATWFEQFGDRIRCSVEADDGRRVDGAQVVIAMNTTPLHLSRQHAAAPGPGGLAQHSPLGGGPHLAGPPGGARPPGRHPTPGGAGRSGRSPPLARDHRRHGQRRAPLPLPARR